MLASPAAPAAAPAPRIAVTARIQTLLTWTVAAAIFAMMLLQCADVVARKLLGIGLPGVVELVELLMLVTVFAGLPLASLQGEHVLFDLFDPWLPARLKHLQSRLADLCCAAILAGIGVLLFARAARTASYGDTTPILSIGLANFHYAIAALLLLTAAMHLGLAFVPAPSIDDTPPETTP